MSDALRSKPAAVVIGGGVVGLCAADALAARGYRVTVLERGALAMEASWAGGGILSPLPPWQVSEDVWTLVARSLALYPALCESLRTETGIDPQYWRCGMDVISDAAGDDAERWCAARGLSLERLTLGGAGGSLAAIRLPWVAQIRNPRFCRALVARLHARGVVLKLHCGEVDVDIETGVAVARYKDQLHRAEVMVVAAGAWTGTLLSRLSWSVPVQPVKGQMLALQTDGGSVERIVLQEGRYLIPRRDGVVLVGSTLEDTGFEKHTSADAALALRAFADAVCPRLRGVPCIAHWAGLRPGTPNGVPLIQRHPSIGNLYVNSGHFRYGLTMALASAERLLQIIEN